MKKFYYIRLGLAVISGILLISGFLGVFYPLQIFDLQFTPLLQRVFADFSLIAAVLFGALLVITLLFGRIYCSTLCPLGLYQEFLTLIFRRKQKTQKSRAYKYFLAALVFGVIFGGTALFARFADPYTLSGAAVSGAVAGLVFILLLTVLVWFKGRLFCGNICPVGAVLGLISRFSVFKIRLDKTACVSCGLCASKCPTGSIDFKNKTVNNETCIKCLRCLTACRRSGLRYGLKKTEDKVPFNPSRRQFLTGGAALAVLLLAVKGGVEIGRRTAKKIRNMLLPAGAVSTEDFANRCLNCNLCVQNCPMKIIKKADGDFPVVHLDYGDSFCDYNCHKCSEVCPSGAIRKLTLEQKRKTQIGLAQISTDICIKCGLCVMKCPRKAISREYDAFPQVDAGSCIGCGACAAGCPVKAINIAASRRQKTL